MKKVMIIGNCGSGKSTLSRVLHKITNLPLYHLDQCYWKPNWTEPSKTKWESIVTDLVLKEQWIIDGNYGGTMDIRIQHADTIIYLDIPVIKSLWRVLKRVYTYHGQVRPDMPPGCKERFDFDFLHYVAVYKITRGKSIIQKLNKAKSLNKQIVILKSDKDTKQFLNSIKD